MAAKSRSRKAARKTPIAKVAPVVPMRLAAPLPPRRLIRFVGRWQTLLIGAGVIGSALLFMFGYAVKLYQSGPLPVPGRNELISVDKEHDGRENTLNDQINLVTTGLTNLVGRLSTVEGKVNGAELADLTKALATARTRYERTHDEADEKVVEVLQKQVNSARKQ